MEKSLKLELLSLKDDQIDSTIMQRRSYRRMSTFMSPRDAHQIVDIDDSKIIQNDRPLLKQSHIFDENMRMNSLDDNIPTNKNDYIQNKAQQYFDKKMKEEIQKSVGQPIFKKQGTSTKYDKTITNIIHHMKQCQKKCQLAKKMAQFEVKRVVLQQNEEQFKSRPSTSQQLIQNHQIKLKKMLQKSPPKNISQSRISSTINSSSSLNEIDKVPQKNENQISRLKLLQEEEYQLNNTSLKQRVSPQTKENPIKFRRSLKKEVQQQNNDSKTLQNPTQQSDSQSKSKSPNPKILIKNKSVFHQLYSKKGTLDNSEIFDELKDSSNFLTLTDSQESIKKLDKLIRRTPEKQFRILNEQRNKSPEEPYKFTFSEANSSFNSLNNEKGNINSYYFDGKMKSGAFSPKRSQNAFKSDRPNSTYANLDSTFKRKASPHNQKIQFLQQMSEIVDDVQEVCTDLIDDAKLYQNSTIITSNLDYYKNKMNEKRQIWLENPQYHHVKEKLKQKKQERDLAYNNGHFHPYYQFLGYDRLDQIPKNRANNEIIEQRYAYFLHKKGVDLAHQSIHDSPNRDDFSINLEKLKKEQRLSKLKNLLVECNSKSQIYRKEDDERESRNSNTSKSNHDSFGLIQNFIEESPARSPSRGQRKSTFIPLEFQRKHSLQRQLHTSQESTQKSFTSLSRQNALIQFGKLQESLLVSPKNEKRVESPKHQIASQSPKQQQLQASSSPKHQKNPNLISGIFSTNYDESEEKKENPTSQKIGKIDGVPIIKQILTRYGRINNKEGDQIISKIQSWRQSEEHLQVIDKDYFFNKLEEQKLHLVEKFEKIEQNQTQLKRQQSIEKIKKKFSSKQKLTIEKIYKQERQWEEAIEGVQEATSKIDNLIETARSRVNSLKTNNSFDPDIVKVYKRASLQTGIKFCNLKPKQIK